jgi:large subunit ribosomal protein L10
LASVPSKEVLLTQVAGLLQSPIARFARVLGAVAAAKGGSAEAPVAEAAAA